MIRLLDALDTAADGAFIVNKSLKLVYWNKAAEEMLGFRQTEIVGRYCYQVLKGYDELRHLICTSACQVARMAFQEEPISNYEVRTQTKAGDRCWLNMSIFTYMENSQSFIIHLFRDIDQKKKEESFFRRLMEVAKQYHHLPDNNLEKETQTVPDVLSPRELQVLSLLARGQSTKDMAETLSISPNTVRNHVQHILQKLQVHSRIEAVAFAIQNDLV